MKGVIDNGEIIASTQGSSISFEVPARATYARVTASKGPLCETHPKEGVPHGGEQWAWTQPFWVNINGAPTSSDPRHKDTSNSLSAWTKVPDKKRIVLSLYDEEASEVMRTRSAHSTPRCFIVSVLLLVTLVL